MSLIENIQQDFSRYLLQADSGSDFVHIRENAFKEFEKLGFPTTKNEEWKYTNFKKVFDLPLQSTCAPVENAEELLNASILKNIKANKLVFINGCFHEELSTIVEKDADVLICNLAKARKAYPEQFNKHFGKYLPVNNESLNALNTALMSDGAFVFVPNGKHLEYPVFIFNISDSSQLAVLAQPRNLIVVEKNASVHIVESFYSAGVSASFCNAVTEVFVDENAHLEHYKVQRQTGEAYLNHFTQIFQEANTNINHVTLTLDGKMVRNNLHFYMNGQNCNSLLYGLYITEKDSFVDNHTRVDHAKPNCFSDEKYKGVLKDSSTAVFNGKIMVHLDAQKTNAYQRNQNILLSNDATVNTKPQLEIFADDVKCTHGATIGQLDEEPLFYLRSRGIPEDAARKLLLIAFADDIAEKIKIPELVQLLENEIERKL